MSEKTNAFEKLAKNYFSSMDKMEYHQRAIAVAAALELINTEIAGRSSGSSINSQLSQLGQYADHIQAALESE